MKPAALALLFAAGCATSSGPVEIVTLPPAPPPGPWLVMHEAIDHCARTYAIAPPVRARVTFNHNGLPLSVASAYGDEFASCVGRSIQRTRYRAQRNRTLLIELAPATATAY